ncbi:unnamed protein product [Withania somnifera]
MSMNNKDCELCVKKKAKMYCESDEANLCWDCDFKVHSANFLVAKHTRNLLCHSCQNTTPWSASGPKLSPTFSFCNSCLENPAEGFKEAEIADRVEELNTHMDEYDSLDDDDDEEEEEEEEEDEDIDDEDEDENQVVPLSSSPVSTRSGSYGGGATVVVNSSSSSSRKRLRESDCLHSEDEEACSSSLNCHNLLEENKGTSSSIGFLRPRKMLQTNDLCE